MVPKILEVHCVWRFTHHMQSKDPSSQLEANFGGHGDRVQRKYYGLRCTLERITLSTLKA